MKTVFDLPSLRREIIDWKQQGLRIAFVPTMGNLHDGHLSLLERAGQLGDRTIVSIFVNPIQFGRGEDYENYPSTLDADREKLESSKLDLLFTPDLKELYPGGMDSDTRVNVPKLSTILCGKFRPDHFSGVATVVTKLLINVTPDVALFGEKDYQQLLIIRRLVSDLCIPTTIADGLAMSSRNAYLTPEQRQMAPVIYQTLQAAADSLLRSSANIAGVEESSIHALEAGGLRPEYFSVRRSANLAVAGPGDRDLSILVAAWLGSARLIDNIRITLV
jgi:pantoate--beta-alanine ligase